MNYYFAKKVSTNFDETIELVTQRLQEKGFGVLTEIDVAATMKKKLDVDFKPYRILGACNPSLALKALTAEDKIGTMLPCNVIVQEIEPGVVEVAAVDPAASLAAVENNGLESIATEVRNLLKSVIENL